MSMGWTSSFKPQYTDYNDSKHYNERSDSVGRKNMMEKEKLRKTQIRSPAGMRGDWFYNGTVLRKHVQTDMRIALPNLCIIFCSWRIAGILPASRRFSNYLGTNQSSGGSLIHIISSNMQSRMICSVFFEDWIGDIGIATWLSWMG